MVDTNLLVFFLYQVNGELVTQLVTSRPPDISEADMQKRVQALDTLERQLQKKQDEEEEDRKIRLPLDMRAEPNTIPYESDDMDIKIGIKPQAPGVSVRVKRVDLEKKREKQKKEKSEEEEEDDEKETGNQAKRRRTGGK